MKFQSVIFMGMRALSILSKVALSFYILREMSLEEYGEYSLALLIINTLVIFIGFDIYNYTHSVIFDGNRFYKGKDVIAKHISLSLIICTFILGLALLLDSLELGYFKTVIFILVCSVALVEYLLQEVYRYLVIFENHWFANLCLLSRNIAWPIVVVALFNIGLTSLSANSILFIWLSVNLSVLFLCAFLFGVNFNIRLNSYFSYIELKEMSIFILPFFLSSLIFKVSEYADRFIVSLYVEPQLLGVYTYLFTFANLVQTFVFAGVISISYPSYVRSVKASDNVKKNFNSFQLKVFGSSFFLAVATLIIFPYMNDLLNKSLVNDFLFELLIVLAGTIITLVSTVPHYFLFAKKAKGSIFKVHLIACFSSILLSMLLIPYIGIKGAAIAMLIASILIFILKTYYVFTEMDIDK